MNKFIKTLMLTLFIIASSNAYATFDIPAAMFITGGKFENIKQRIIEEMDKIKRTQDNLTAGWKGVKDCVGSFNPSTCINMGKSLKSLGAEYGDQISNINVLPNTGLDKVDKDTKSADIINSIKDGAIYKSNQGNSIEEANKQSKINNAMLADDIATLFAKSTAVRQKILTDTEQTNTIDGEKSNLYQKIEDDEDTSVIIQKKARQRIESVSRITRIMELRAYMIGIPATSELTKYVKDGSTD